MAREQLKEKFPNSTSEITLVRKDKLKPCQVCHRLALTHHAARQSANLYGLCDPNRSDVICAGLDQEAIDQMGWESLHSVLFGTSVGKSCDYEEELLRFIEICIGRQNSETCITEFK